jgi:hypothetical protein
MGIGAVFPSVHKHKGWVGQYQRMIRWYEKFKKTDPGDFEALGIEDDHDILFTCFQNIFILKDWLHHSASIPKKTLNDFIETNLELQICRDICNGTKHFDLKQASVDNDFTIIREFVPFHKERDLNRNRIIILTGGHKYELKELAHKCILLWNQFLRAQKLIN